jgi:uncharacterized membrane protein YidH (DUF202 family)
LRFFIPAVSNNPTSTSPKETEAERTLDCFQHFNLLLLTIGLRISHTIPTNNQTQLVAGTARHSHAKKKMNTTSLILTGSLAAALTITLRNPNNKSNSNTKHPLPSSSPTRTSTTPTPPNTPTSSPALRTKHHLRRISSNSTGWYLDADTPTLQDFEARAQTLVKRLEKFANRCATDFVMGLMSPAAVVLILFNPVMLVLMGLVIFAMS